MSHVAKGLAAAILVGCGVLAAAPPLWSENLIPNGELDLDALGWEWEGGAQDLDWNDLDHDGCGAESGSALVLNDEPTASWILNAHTCVTGILPGSRYSLDSFLRFPTGQTGEGSAWITIVWVDSSSSCNGDMVGHNFTGALPSSNAGVWVHKALRSLIAPVGAHSAHVAIALEKESAGGELRLRFDGIHLVPGNGYLFGDGFESASLCRWDPSAP